MKNKLSHKIQVNSLNKLSIRLFIFFGFHFLSFGQTTTKYIIGNYQIDPENKTIAVLKGFSGTDGDMHYWGEEFVIDSTINYEQTMLYIFGNQVIFKEHLSEDWIIPKNIDFDSFKILDFNLNGYSICRDRNNLYQNYIGTKNQIKWVTIYLNEYQEINDFIYKKSDTLYFLSDDFKLEEIKGDIKFHLSSLKHITGNYFKDKNGLYYLDSFYTQEIKNRETDTGLILWSKEWEKYLHKDAVKLEKSKGKKAEIELKNDYFIYQNHLYSNKVRTTPYAIPIKPDDFNYLVLNHNRQKIKILADKENTYVSVDNRGFTPLDSIEKSYWSFWSINPNILKSNIYQWKIINPEFMGTIEDNKIYFPSAIKHPKDYLGNLIKKENKYHYFTLKDSQLKEAEQLFIFNYDTQKYEPVNLSEYRYLSKDLWIYKNRLYMTNLGLPTKEKIHTDNLDFIKINDKETNFLKDNESIIYIGNIEGHSLQGENGRSVQVLGNRTYSKIDFQSLTVISADILMDNKNLYVGDFMDGIRVIPYKQLGLKLKIFTQDQITNIFVSR